MVYGALGRNLHRPPAPFRELDSPFDFVSPRWIGEKAENSVRMDKKNRCGAAVGCHLRPPAFNPVPSRISALITPHRLFD